MRRSRPKRRWYCENAQRTLGTTIIKAVPCAVWLIHAIEEPKQRYHKEATADSEQPAKKTGHPTEARCGGDVNCCCEHRGLMSRVSGDATVPSRDHRGHEGNRTRQQGQVRCRVRSGKSTLTKTKRLTENELSDFSRLWHD